MPFKRVKLDNLAKARIVGVAFGAASLLAVMCWGEFIRLPERRRTAARAAKAALALAYAHAEARGVPYQGPSLEPYDVSDSVELRRYVRRSEIARAEAAYVLACSACAEASACERDRTAMESPATRTAVEFTPCE